MWHLDPPSRLATAGMVRKLGVCLFGSESWGRGLPPYEVASYSMQLFDHKGHGPKMGAVPLLGGAGSPSSTMSLGRVLPPYLDASSRFTAIDMCGKLAVPPPPLLGRSWVPV